MKLRYLSVVFLFLFFSSSFGLEQPLPVDQAFQFSAAVRDNQTILTKWNIAPGYYMYRERFHFQVIKPDNIRLGQPIMPDGVRKVSPEIGDYEVYQGNLVLPIPVLNPPEKNLILQVAYQGCSLGGFCYPPTKKIVQLNMSGPYNVAVAPLSMDLPETNAAPTQQQSTVELIKGKNVILFILGFLGLGILISLTPCVLPMIPILSSIIVGQKHLTHKRAFAVSCAYVLGMAVTYAIAGVIFGYLGSNIQVILQKPWIIITFSVLFVFLAFSMFGFYDLDLPASLRSKAATVSEHQKRGTYFGAFIMGILSTLILSPCVTAPLVAVLGYISHTGNAALGGIALFTMGIGMGAPLLAIGAAGPKLMPKTGAWMNVIKSLLGVLLLGVAIWMLARILPGQITLALWAGLAIGTAIYLGAFHSTQKTSEWIFKILGILLFSYGVLMAAGSYLGNSNPLQPITASSSKDQLNFISVKTVADVEKEVAKAQKAGKFVMLDFYADWCISCKEMDHFTFSNPKVKQQLSGFVLLRADVTANDEADKAIERHFNVVAPPTILFFDKTGNEITPSRIIGEMSADKFLQHLQKISQ